MEDIEKVQKKTTKLIPESSETHELYRQIEKMSADYTTLLKNTRRHD